MTRVPAGFTMGSSRIPKFFGSVNFHRCCPVGQSEYIVREVPSHVGDAVPIDVRRGADVLRRDVEVPPDRSRAMKLADVRDVHSPSTRARAGPLLQSFSNTGQPSIASPVNSSSRNHPSNQGTPDWPAGGSFMGPVSRALEPPSPSGGKPGCSFGAGVNDWRVGFTMA